MTFLEVDVGDEARVVHDQALDPADHAVGGVHALVAADLDLADGDAVDEDRQLPGGQAVVRPGDLGGRVTVLELLPQPVITRAAPITAADPNTLRAHRV